MSNGDFLDVLEQPWEEEGLFSRDVDGQLIRIEKSTESDYDKIVSLSIDGVDVEVPKAVPKRDAQGNILFDEFGQTIPRETTIYDAAQKAFVDKVGDENPIPTLCHRDHMTPVGVCRVCCVEVYREDRNGNLSSGGKLLPACFHPVKPKMVVHTVKSPERDKSERVRDAVKTLTDLLISDHLTEKKSANQEKVNELAALKKEFGGYERRFQIRPEERKSKGKDNSAILIDVNHDACILCERCMRGCSEIKQNFVIGRTGKGYDARIGFDLDDPMEDSSCVTCGECMISCPTDALSFRKPIAPEWQKEKLADPNNERVTADELLKHPLFKALPYKWLQWNQASIVRRKLKKGDVLCWLGDFGSTAFILNSGEFAFWFKDSVEKSGTPIKSKESLFGKLTRGFRGRARSKPPEQPARTVPGVEPNITRPSSDVIIGEMTCMSFYPRTATVAAWTDAEVFEIRRNVLYMIQRNSEARKILDDVYRERALNFQLRNLELFQSLDDNELSECVAYLKDKAKLIRADPGQTIFQQGEPANEFYIVRVGYVKISQTVSGYEDIRAYIGPGKYFGEIGLFTTYNMNEEIGISQAFSGRRTANCIALDDVELVSIDSESFKYLIDKFPKLREQFVELSKVRIARDPAMANKVGKPLTEFLGQGLFNAQKLLVLDLESCTRCDECVKACADTHDGISRFIRDGLRFDKFLVASACRSCQDPYCMVGCPVDSIHRNESLEISIESHCIGCGLCAQNCPYGNINMVEYNEERPRQNNPNETMAVVQNRATTCDLCRSVGVDASHKKDEVSCVYACPHNAAFRMSGEELFGMIKSADS